MRGHGRSRGGSVLRRQHGPNILWRASSVSDDEEGADDDADHVVEEAVAAVLSHYAGYIRFCAKMDGRINTDMQEHIIGRLIESLLKFRFDR